MKHDSQTELTLNSLDKLQQATMPLALRERIISNLSARKPKIISLRRPVILLAAAGLALLIGFNVYSMAAHSRAVRAGIAAAPQPSPLAEEYFAPAPSI